MVRPRKGVILKKLGICVKQCWGTTRQTGMVDVPSEQRQSDFGAYGSFDRGSAGRRGRGGGPSAATDAAPLPGGVPYSGASRRGHLEGRHRSDLSQGVGVRFYL